MTQNANFGSIPDGSGASVRAALNTNLQILATENEGSSSPSGIWPFQLWRDNTNKFVKRRNAANSAWEIVENYGSTTDPGAGDDGTVLYVRGSRWINTTGNKYWVCTNPATGAAIWKEIGAGGGSTQAFGTIAVSGQSDVVADAAPDTLTIAGTSGVTITTNATTDTVTFAPTYGTTSTTVCVGNDARLSDSRTPTSHATTHKSGGGDAIKLDELAAPTDISTLNASTSVHGLLRKLDNVVTHYLDGTGAWSTPSAVGFLPINAKTYGCTGNGTTDDTTNMQSALTAAAGGCLYIPAGTYKMSSQLALSGSGVTIIGDGMRRTELKWTSGATTRGILLSPSNVSQCIEARYLSLTTLGANVGIAFKVDCSSQITGGLLTEGHFPRVVIQGVVAAGAGAPADTGWNTAFDIMATSGVFRDLWIVGQCSAVPTVPVSGSTGLYIHGNPETGNVDNGHPVQFVIESCNFWYCESGLWTQNCEGALVSHCIAVACSYGYVGASEYGQPQFVIADSHANCGIVGIWVNGMSQVSIHDNLLFAIQDSSGATCLNISSGSGAGNVSGNTCVALGTSANGIVLGPTGGGTADSFIIVNNMLQSAANHMTTGIWLGPNSSNCRAHDNLFIGTITTHYDNDGTNNTYVE